MSDDLVKRLRDPAFGTETTERKLMGSAADRIEELEAKLAKAVEALEKIDREYAEQGGWCGTARTTIAELKGDT